MITRVFDRLRNVLVLIYEAKGKNNLVEKKRGKKSRNLDLPIDLTADIVPKVFCAPPEEEVGAEDTV